MKINYQLISWSLIGLLLFYFLYSISGILLPFTVGIFVAYSLNPAVEHLTKWCIPRSVASLIIILSFFVIFGSLLVYALPFLKNELLRLSGLVAHYVKDSSTYIQPFIDHLSPYLKLEDINSLSKNASSYLTNMLSWAFRFLSNLLTNSLALANLISMVILMPLIAFYLLRDWKILLNQIEKLLPTKQSKDILKLATQINTTLGGYVRGQATVCLILAIYYSVGLYFTGLNFAITIGIVTGILSFIPYVGMTIGVAAGMGLALAQFDSGTAIAHVAGVFAIGNIAEGYILAPKLIGDKVGLHPVWIIFALLASGSLFGFIGILFAIPAAAVVGVIVRHFIKLYLNSSLYNIVTKGKIKSAQPSSTDAKS